MVHGAVDTGPDASYVACRGEMPGLAPLPVQYADFAACGSAKSSAPEDDPESLITEQIEYWRQTLAGLPVSSILPS